MNKPIIGEYRLIPKGTPIWSIHNQLSITLSDDEIIEITNTVMLSDYVYGIPKQLLFNIPGYIPTLIGRGRDEWGISYSQTEPYSVPKPQF